MVSPDDLWFVDFGEPHTGEPAFQRPALILGPPGYFGDSFPFAIVAPLTTTYRGLSLHIEIELEQDTGLTTVSYIQCEQLRSVHKNRLMHKIGVVDAATSEQVSQVVLTLLG